MAKMKLSLPVVLAMAAILALHAVAARDLPKETLLKPKAVEPASAPGGPHDADDKQFIAFGGVGGVAGVGGVVGVIPIGDMGGSGLPDGLGGLPSGLGGLGADPGKTAACGTGGGLAGAVGRKPLVPLVP